MRLRRIAIALAVVFATAQAPAALAVTDPQPITHPPKWCEFDSKRDFWLWQVAVQTADRGLMYTVCGKGVRT